MADARIGVGIIGCGTVSSTYIRNFPRFGALKLVAVADIEPLKAASKAAEHGSARAMTVESLLSAPDVDIVLNLTVPAAHHEVSLAALLAGKSVYSEKPLALNVADGRDLVATAAARGLRLGCAPDTFLGSGQQTARILVDEGAIGRPFAATAFRLNHGMEHWHPTPNFFYQRGAGPLFDIGPYYLTALANLLGPVARVAGAVTTAMVERPIPIGPTAGRTISVETPTHVAALLTFASGAVASTINSFDVWGSELPRIEVYGTEGTLSVPDPNSFGGPVRLKKWDADDWVEIPLVRGHAEESRGVGLADMAAAMLTHSPHRASGQLGLHVLEIMESVLSAAHDAVVLELQTETVRPEPLTF